MIDAEKLISKYLRAQTDERVVGKTPNDTDESWVRLTLLNAPAVGGSRTDHLIEALLQLDCYAGESGGQPEAVALGLSVRSALVDAPNHEHDAGTVSGVEIRSHFRLPDETFREARERLIITAAVWMHS